MKRWISSAVVFLSMTLFAALAFAGHAESAKEGLTKAREGLLAMLDATDSTSYKTLEADIKKASATVDAAISKALTDKTLSAAQLTQYKDLKATWEEFKKTRDKEIIPSIKAGKKDDARALAKGIQAERFKKMNELLAALSAK